MSDATQVIKKHHSFHTTPSSISRQPSCWKSEVNFTSQREFSTTNHRKLVESECKDNKEYYKKYEHDDVPVKDDNSFNDHSFSEDNNMGAADSKDSVTNSDLDKLEMKILRKMSQELQTEGDSTSSLESNIKLFKTTVQQIFDNFYQNMQDFELYKKKFNEILAKNKEDSIFEMEDFIKDMFRNICSSNSNDSNVTRTIEEKDLCDRQNINMDLNDETTQKDSAISYKNESYSTDSTLGDSTSKTNGNLENDYLNIFLLSTNPCVEIKMNNRNLLSEINIRNQSFIDVHGQLASADNIKKLVAKKLELEQYIEHKNQDHLEKDKEIPVKSSIAKKNIYLDEDFVEPDKNESNKFFIFKICSYICKKLRKN